MLFFFFRCKSSCECTKIKGEKQKTKSLFGLCWVCIHFLFSFFVLISTLKSCTYFFVSNSYICLALIFCYCFPYFFFLTTPDRYKHRGSLWQLSYSLETIYLLQTSNNQSRYVRKHTTHNHGSTIRF